MRSTSFTVELPDSVAEALRLAPPAPRVFQTRSAATFSRVLLRRSLRSKVAVDRLIADSGFVGLDAGPLRLARELEAPGRLYRVGLVGIAEARRLLKEIASLPGF
jgi:predicted dinucleotide-binding enzyme